MSGVAASSSAPVPAPAAAGAAEDEADEAHENSTIYDDYECRSLAFGVPHPSEIAEPRGLAAVALPPPSYPLRDSLDRCSIIDEGKLSCLQLEGVQYACQRHQLILPGGARAGFFLGDGAGVGKGRQISGIIADNFARGRTQHVWMSTSSDLKLDAERDLRDLGMHCKVIDGCQDLDSNTKAFGLSKDFKEGVLFSTYSTLIGAARGSKASRIDQIIKWCGGETFDGLLVFDECHRAKNFQVGEKEDASSKTSKCVIELQKRLPLARVVYASATGVTELGNLAYCDRLGLWGEGCPFLDFESFLKVVSKKGIFFLEMLAMELKREGAYVSRGLSFKRAEFETLTLALTADQVRVYDKAAELWSDIRNELQKAIALTNASARLMSIYWGCHQRFFKQLIVSMKTDVVVSEAKSALENGFAVVIGLQQTGEASMVRRMNQEGNANHEAVWLSSARESVLAMLEDHFPTIAGPSAGKPSGDQAGDSLMSSHATPQKDDDGGWLGSISEGSVVPVCAEMKATLLKRARELDLPNSALDMLIDRLGGPSHVAEMTGRSNRIVRKADGKVAHEQRGAGDSEVERINVAECRAFQEGKKLVSIISDAASVGISLHAKRGGGNERRRVHLTVELPWSADKAVQQLGRSHRSNQASAPVYKLVVSELGGEKRFCSAVAKRLQSLGALTRGDRRAATGQDLQEFNVQTSMGISALKKVFASIDEGIQPLPGTKASATDLQEMQMALEFIGLGAGRKENEAGNVSRFLSRLLGLPVRLQNMVFDYFMDTLSHDIAVAEKEGNYSDAIRDLYGGDNIDVQLKDSEEVYKDPITSATCSVYTLLVDRGLPWEAAVARLKQAQEKSDGADETHTFRGGFYETKNLVPGRNATGWVMAIEKQNWPGEFNVWRPNTGAGKPILLEDLKAKYSKRSEEAAEKMWQVVFEDSKKWNPESDKGARVISVRLLCGSLIPVWDQLHEVVQKASARGGAGVTGAQAEMKVVRMTAGAHQYIGLRLPRSVIEDIKRQLARHADLLSGKLLKVSLPPAVLSFVGANIAANPHEFYNVMRKFQAQAYVGEILLPVIVALGGGKVFVDVPVPGGRDGQHIQAEVPKGTRGEFVTAAPFFVPVPVQAGDSSVKGARVEEVSPIHEKLLKKVITPAPTLLTFFKAKSSAPEESGGRVGEGGVGRGRGAESAASAKSQSQKRGIGAFFGTSPDSQGQSGSKKVRVDSSRSRAAQKGKGTIGSFFQGGGKAGGSGRGNDGGAKEMRDTSTVEIDLTAEDSR